MTKQQNGFGADDAAAGMRPDVVELDREECLEILARNYVGRIAFEQHGRIEIAPIHYVLDGEWLFGRTSVGRKLVELGTNWWVAFEVDEVDSLFEWRSVVVHGGIYLLTGPDPADDGVLLERAVASLRRLIPQTFEADDPVPERTLVFGVALQEVTGRAATPVPRDA